MKILFVWTGVTSYMADCWRKLQQEPGVELRIVVEQVSSGNEFVAEKVLAGLDYELVSDHQRSLSAFACSPDVIFAVGWHSKVVRDVVTRGKWKGVPKICCSDMPWRWKFRCIAARFVLWRYLRQFVGMMVPGAFGRRYARWLGFPPDSIFEGMYGIDTGRFASSEDASSRAGSGFLYVGRFAPEKRLDVLLKAYARYRDLGGTWSLDLYGTGSLPSLPNHVRVHSFVQPDEIPRIYHEHAAFVLASDFDPWPLVILESCASGLPVVVTDRCTNYVEFVGRNGLVVPHGNVEAFACAMLRLERKREAFDVAEGLRSAARYSCAAWSGRILEIVRRLGGRKR